MSVSDLPDKWERQAKFLRYEAQREHDDRARLDKELVADIRDLHAAELRAALEEKPQPVAFQFGDNFQYAANFWPPENVGDTPIRPLYPAPVSWDELRGMLVRAIGSARTIDRETHAGDLADEILSSSARRPGHTRNPV